MSARIRTGYSFRAAYGALPEVMSRVKEMGLIKAPITDTASTFGFVKWSKLCDKNEIKPVFGVELAVTTSINAKKPSVDYWTFIAQEDLEAINSLVEIATSQFRYQPLLSVEQALEAKGVFKIVGYKTQLDHIENQSDLFIGLSPSLVRGQFNRFKKEGFGFVAVSDNRYPRPDDKAAYEVVCGRSASIQSYDQTLMDDSAWQRAVVADPTIMDAALRRRDDILDRSNAELHNGTLVRPQRPSSLLKMCEQGAQKLGINLNDSVYKERLTRELKLIKDKEFEDYFYIIADICKWARERMVVGPARGSSCGSLVCYLLEITTIDPIPYGLIFERFIDINRNDLPDIDIDFSDKRRQLVFDYMVETYGNERVARLGTVALYKPKSCLNEAGAALDIPPWEIQKVSDSIIDRSSGDARALQAVEDTLNDTEAGRNLVEQFPEILIAKRMEGHPRHSSQHAAGIIITEKPVREYIALDSRVGAIQCDKKDAEDLDLLKIDALGLTQLSVFEDALNLAGLSHTHLETVPLDDPAAFKVLNDKKYSGIFQFNGLALQSVTDQITVDNLEDIISITALARPGPLNTGGTNTWIRVKNGTERVHYPHPLFEPFLKNTLGVVAYQEQVMEIGRNIGDLSWGDVTALRKAMSRSLGKEYFDQFGDKWKVRAIEKGVDKDIAHKVWDDLCAYGSWAFNRSHAVAYGVVSYWCCWLKAHYPLEFAAATLTSMDNPDAQIKFLREMQDEGVEYVAADREISVDKWTVGNREGSKILVGPLSNVHGIGPKLEQQILSCRARNEPLPSRAEKLLAEPKTKIDSIWPITDRILELMPDPREKNIVSAPKRIIDIQTTGAPQPQVMVFCRIAQIKPRDENDPMALAKRGYAYKGPHMCLNLRLEDDSDIIFAKINRFDYQRLAHEIIERGRAGRALYAIKGEVPKNFRMISVKAVRYIGDMEINEEDNESKTPN